MLPHLTIIHITIKSSRKNIHHSLYFHHHHLPHWSFFISILFHLQFVHIFISPNSFPFLPFHSQHSFSFFMVQHCPIKHKYYSHPYFNHMRPPNLFHSHSYFPITNYHVPSIMHSIFPIQFHPHSTAFHFVLNSLNFIIFPCSTPPFNTSHIIFHIL